MFSVTAVIGLVVSCNPSDLRFVSGGMMEPSPARTSDSVRSTLLSEAAPRSGRITMLGSTMSGATRETTAEAGTASVTVSGRVIE